MRIAHLSAASLLAMLPGGAGAWRGQRSRLPGAQLTMKRRALLALTGGLSLSLIASWPVGADCQPAGPIDAALPTAPVAFVGTVTAVDGPIATLAVSEVWAGQVAEVVEVRGLSDEAGGRDTGFGAGFTEDDRHWSEGSTYLVVPWVDGTLLRDSICTATTEWRAELEPLRPEDARIVAGEPANAPTVPVEGLIVAVAVLVIGGISLVAFRRR